jgi:hypothetical protein
MSRIHPPPARVGGAIFIRLRAERRLGAMMRQQKETIGMNAGGLLRGAGRVPRDESPTLSEAGIDKHLADRARKLDRMSDEEFEDHAAEAKRTKRIGPAGQRSLHGGRNLQPPEKTARPQAGLGRKAGRHTQGGHERPRVSSGGPSVGSQGRLNGASCGDPRRIAVSHHWCPVNL